MSDPSIQAHNERPAEVWSSGGEAYEVVSRQIGPALEHCVARLDPKPGEQILDLATGTGWTSRLAARRGASVVGADIASDLLAVAKQHASKEGLTSSIGSVTLRSSRLPTKALTAWCPHSA
jgi:2-polyprenyl-3-methyl-5-hydroxy-6-metoxy-1,4-benzoquinol methylase